MFVLAASFWPAFDSRTEHVFVLAASVWLAFDQGGGEATCRIGTNTFTTPLRSFTRRPAGSWTAYKTPVLGPLVKQTSAEMSRPAQFVAKTRPQRTIKVLPFYFSMDMIQGKHRRDGIHKILRTT